VNKSSSSQVSPANTHKVCGDVKQVEGATGNPDLRELFAEYHDRHEHASHQYRRTTGPERLASQGQIGQCTQHEHQAAMPEFVPHRNVLEPSPVPSFPDIGAVDDQSEEAAEDEERQSDSIHGPPADDEKTVRQFRTLVRPTRDLDFALQSTIRQDGIS
jgi:hypothetical protein